MKIKSVYIVVDDSQYKFRKIFSNKKAAEKFIKQEIKESGCDLDLSVWDFPIYDN